MFKQIRIPASKSISNRVLVMAAFNGLGKKIHNILKCEDTEVMFEAYKQLGVEYNVLEETCDSIDIEITAAAAKNLEASFYMNNSGTATRFLIPCLGLINGEFFLDGCERMRERPIHDLVEALKGLGVNIEYLGATGFLPLAIKSTGKLTGKTSIKCDLSSQYLSGLLIAQALSNNSFEVEIEGEVLVSKPYIDLTNQVIEEFLKFDEYEVEADYSSASYFAALGILGEQDILIPKMNPNSLQADRKFIQTLIDMGAQIDFIGTDLFCKKSNLKSLGVINCEDFPDAAMTLAMVASLIQNQKTVLNGLSTLKHKECDRLVALETELKKVGVNAVADDESLTIYGVNPKELVAAKVETYNDHRMAMCFAILQYFNPEIEILNPTCVSKTFPEFWISLKSL